MPNNSHAAGAAGHVQQAKEEIPIMSNAGKTGLVVTAHPGDFVWRAGGAIALHVKKGYRVKIACLSFGERGESQFAWKEAGATMEKVKAGRRDEAIERYRRLLRSYPGDVASLDAASRLLREAGRADDARALVEECARRAP